VSKHSKPTSSETMDNNREMRCRWCSGQKVGQDRCLCDDPTYVWMEQCDNCGTWRDVDHVHVPEGSDDEHIICTGRCVATDGGEPVDLERERKRNYELGRIAKLEDIADDLRERAGEKYAHSSSRRETEKAKQLKSLAEEFEERAEGDREAWEEKYDDE